MCLRIGLGGKRIHIMLSRDEQDEIPEIKDATK